MCSSPRASLLLARLGFALALLLALLAWWSLQVHAWFDLWAFGALSMLPVALTTRSYSAVLEALFLVVNLWIYQALGLEDPWLLSLALLVPMLAWPLGALRSWPAAAVGLSVSLAWLWWLPWGDYGLGWWALLGFCLLAWPFFLLGLAHAAHGPPRHVDLVVNSYSSNSAHLAERFADGVRSSGAQVSVHRFHHQERFEMDLQGDALAISFPVIGWRPSWPVMTHLLARLPRGRGKPAFVLYTAGGAPENAGVFVQLALLLKGYRPAGRAWLQYPFNLPTARIGPKVLWRFIDGLVPLAYEQRLVEGMGADWAAGRTAGWPFVFWPTPWIPIALPIENPWFDRYAIRNHVFRKRCNGCGLCVRTCPVERLEMVDGIPRAQGTCAVCVACVNNCPTNAMHMWGFTEYGQQYWARWPKLLVKKRPKGTRPG